MPKMRRAPRGSRHDAVDLRLLSAPENKELLRLMAKRAGVSMSVMLDHILEHLELSDQGVPVTWGEIETDGELPIDTA